MVFKRTVEGEINKAKNCKVAVFSCPLDAMQTETKVCNHNLYISAAAALSCFLFSHLIRLQMIHMKCLIFSKKKKKKNHIKKC